MTDKTPETDDKLPEREVEARFHKLVGTLVNTPPKPHKDEPKRRPKEE